MLCNNVKSYLTYKVKFAVFCQNNRAKNASKIIYRHCQSKQIVSWFPDKYSHNNFSYHATYIEIRKDVKMTGLLCEFIIFPLIKLLKFDKKIVILKANFLNKYFWKIPTFNLITLIFLMTSYTATLPKVFARKFKLD